MKLVHASSRKQWRRWLARNHDRLNEGVWLVFQKPGSRKPSVSYEEALEEALCFGWIDSIVKRIDDHSYCRKFTPRRAGSAWSPSNQRRVEKILKRGGMTRHGLAEIEAAKRSGNWDRDRRPIIGPGLPTDLAGALRANAAAKQFFRRLAPGYRRQFVAWVVTAKRPETRRDRVRQSLALLASGQKLGLK